MPDIRSRTEEYLDSLDEEKMRELLDLAMLQQKTVWRLVECKHCHRKGKYEVEVPMPASIAKAIKDLGEFTKGKVPEQVNVDVRHWQGIDMREWPTEALMAVATREVIEDGEFEALPAPGSED